MNIIILTFVLTTNYNDVVIIVTTVVVVVTIVVVFIVFRWIDTVHMANNASFFIRQSAWEDELSVRIV